MALELIKLEDGVLIEVENSDNHIEQISGGSANQLDKNIDIVMPLLKRVISPLKNTFDELNKDMSIEKAEVEIGLGFEAGGDVFIVKGNGYVGINTNTPDKLFTVNGDARITGDIYYGPIGDPLNATYSKPDLVFGKNYNKDLDILKVEKFIKKNNHLPWLTSAK